MDLSIVLWIGGMLFSLGIFAVKVGFGLGFGGMRWKGIFLTLSMYLVLFILIAMLSESLIKVLEPVLKKGPYLHILMATGMIAWGFFTIRGLRHTSRSTPQSECCGVPIVSTLLLIVPCPVCIAAMTFSTWAALSVIKLPSLIVGIGLGVIFALLTLAIVGLTRIKQTSSPEISLGLGMIVIGFYFMASLYLPAKIEEAKGVYRSFIPDGNNVDMSNGIGMFVLLFLSLIIGYFAHKRMEVKE